MPTGHLGAFTFATVAGAGTSLGIINITPAKESVIDIPLPTLAIAKGAGLPYEAGELWEGGEFEFELADDNDTQIVDSASASSGATFKKIGRTSGTCVWTKPPAGANTNGATRTFSGYVKEHGEGQQETGKRNTISVKVKVSGTITKVAGS